MEFSTSNSSTQPHVENRQEESGSMSPVEDRQDEHSEQSQAAQASVQARQRRRIAQLEEKLEALESGRAVKERYGGTKMVRLALLTFCRQSNYYIAQGRAIRRVVALFDNVEDLVGENDRRCDDNDDDQDTTVE
jgi:hypothetical protein